MIRLALRRVVSTIPTLILLLTLTFFLLRLAPGGPFDGERVWPAEVQANIDQKYGLNQPLPEQYVRWMADLARGDLRESFQYVGRPVTEMIAESLSASFVLGLLALFMALTSGIPLGALAAWQKGHWPERMITGFAVALVSLPSFVVATLLILVFSLYLGWVPPALWESPSSAILPAVTLALRPFAMIVRLTQASLLDALHSDYIRTARGKGVTEPWVVLKHALKNSLIPLLTVLGPITAHLVTGSFLVETVFQIPGLGRHFVTAVVNRDYPLVMGLTLTFGVILLTSNLTVDLLYAWIDPRIRLEERPQT